MATYSCEWFINLAHERGLMSWQDHYIKLKAEPDALDAEICVASIGVLTCETCYLRDGKVRVVVNGPTRQIKLFIKEFIEPNGVEHERECARIV